MQEYENNRLTISFRHTLSLLWLAKYKAKWADKKPHLQMQDYFRDSAAGLFNEEEDDAQV